MGWRVLSQQVRKGALEQHSALARGNDDADVWHRTILAVRVKVAQDRFAAMSLNLAVAVPNPAARHLQAVVDALVRIDVCALAPIAEALADVRRRGGQVLIAGNGGSATTAAHLALSLTHDLSQRG